MAKRLKMALMGLMGLLYIVAGVNHLLHPQLYVAIMPPYLPFPLQLVYVSGLCEIFLGILLWVHRYSRLAAWGIMALLVAVFPANIQMALHPEVFPQLPVTGLWLRLPLQGLLILWAYWFTRR